MGYAVPLGDSLRARCPGCRREIEIVVRAADEDVCYCPHCAADLLVEEMTGTTADYIDRLREALREFLSPAPSDDRSPVGRMIDLSIAAHELADKICRVGYRDHRRTPATAEAAG